MALVPPRCMFTYLCHMVTSLWQGIERVCMTLFEIITAITKFVSASFPQILQNLIKCVFQYIMWTYIHAEFWKFSLLHYVYVCIVFIVVLLLFSCLKRFKWCRLQLLTQLRAGQCAAYRNKTSKNVIIAFIQKWKEDT